MDVDEQIRRIQLKIRHAQQIGWEARASHFAVDSHRLRFEAPMADREVRRFEKRVGITLPHAYRAFITRVASSGGGPYYGLLPLSQGSVELGTFDASHLALPCLARPGIEYTADWMADLGYNYDDDDDEPYRGLLALAHQGCEGWCALPYRIQLPVPFRLRNI